MHCKPKKPPMTDDELLRRKKEQELKIKAYKSLMVKIYSKRFKNDLDLEMLDVTGKLLLVNPEIHTLWNIRKQTILKLNLENRFYRSLYPKDLAFTEQILQIQPKSSTTWFHRNWLLENCHNPDWDKEFVLCVNYLKLDDRNLRYWNQRRLAVEKAKVPLEKELDYCTEEIEINFGNYSTWHYRSKLIPALFPHEEKPQQISEEKLKEELALALGTALGESGDYNAWCYHRWLLGFSKPDFDFAVFKMTQEYVIIAFSQPIDLNRDGIFNGTLLDELLNGSKWYSGSGKTFDTVWALPHDWDVSQVGDFEIEFERSNGSKVKMHICRVIDALIGMKIPQFCPEFSTLVIDLLKNQLNECNQFLEQEPENKWGLLTAAFILRIINRKDKENHQRSIELLQKLVEVDPLRVGYYQDLASKWNIEVELENWIKGGNLKGQLNLSKLGITNLCYEQYMCAIEDINLSGNQLTQRCFPRMFCFKSCRRLNLAKNQITSLKVFPRLPELREVNFNGNNIRAKELQAVMNSLVKDENKIEECP